MKISLQIVRIVIFINLIGCSSSDEDSKKEFLCCSDNPFSVSNINNLNDTQEPINLIKIITPNGDALYDVLTIQNIELYPNNKVTIFDLNDNIVFERKDFKNVISFLKETNQTAFFGNHFLTNRELSSGSYKYRVELENENVFVEYGYLCIIRNTGEADGLNLNQCNLPFIDPTL